MPHDSRAVANRILDIAEQHNRPITLMQLVKLVYLANGWWLSHSGGEPLTDTAAQAWQYGPVHPQVYKAFKASGSGPVGFRAIERVTGMPYESRFTEDEEGLLRAVVDSYGGIHAFRLSDMMHKPGTPWSVTKDTKGLYATIDNEIVRQHFDGLKRGERAAA